MCGATDKDPGYRGLWIQCSSCLAWYHGDCLGFRKKPPAGKPQTRPCHILLFMLFCSSGML